ncbi:Uncharacterised protein [Escherichia coli]|uniref:Uncharacterized protein n=1 Tax=Escherichia coli TaxID=562 RepID=A0A2X1M3S0_ECOLX|nr:Uncharacterised protein [Escherichia coli]
MKPRTQFIFATHNANIPVLGDAENVCACEYSDGKIQIVGGGVDAPLVQQHIISVMEGGREAFERRREVYGSWLSKNLIPSCLLSIQKKPQMRLLIF